MVIQQYYKSFDSVGELRPLPGFVGVSDGRRSKFCSLWLGRRGKRKSGYKLFFRGVIETRPNVNPSE